MRLCLYVPVSSVGHYEFEYFETNGLPSEIKSVLKLSLFLPSHELTKYRMWKKVRMKTHFVLINFYFCTVYRYFFINSFCHMIFLTRMQIPESAILNVPSCICISTSAHRCHGYSALQQQIYANELNSIL